jgi:hypothetical protein
MESFPLTDTNWAIASFFCTPNKLTIASASASEVWAKEGKTKPMQNKNIRRFLNFIKFVLMIDKGKMLDKYRTSKINPGH